MQIDLRTVSIKPQRQTYGHIARRFGDKPASRYQEGTYDLQPTANFHYRPTWDPEREIFDVTRTRLKMKDWYAFKDPRQYYYGAWTIARARQQDTAESNFDFVESRNLGALLADDVRQQALDLLLPLRHAAWGANMNNSAICAYGYGTAITQPCMFHAMDNLAVAQYLTRIGLLLGDATSLASAKEHWLYAADWQGLRRCVEDSFVVQDWFELFVAQNLVLDGLMYPLFYRTVVEDELSLRGGAAIAMLTQFMTEWCAEATKWVDAQIKTACAESPENAVMVRDWIAVWQSRALEALTPLAQRALGERAGAALDDLATQFAARVAKCGVPA
ncbi:aromatic/alkene monooxygenase hydroxylase subunit beta [Methyloversatilis sp.]|uniref:aromatic/alkene monooxygenase hydroxylase subunit beta n=1 Tax=Methyloversatilis sp. TaxID=2569862 RepID=UPI0035B43FA5